MKKVISNKKINKKINFKSCKIAIFFGGPSNERNISLDTARTFYDSLRHLLKEKNIYIVFVSMKKQFYILEKKWIYSNTIEDFEDLLFKEKSSKKNNFYQSTGKLINLTKLKTLISQTDAFFPLIHGEFGEDGQLTKLLQDENRKAILGSNPTVLFYSLKKNLTHEHLKQIGFKTTPYFLLSKNNWEQKTEESLKSIHSFFSTLPEHHLVVKPNDCGSSDGVSIILHNHQLPQAIESSFNFSNEVIIEEKINGREFSIIVIQDTDGQPMSLFPTEILLEENHLKDNFYSRQKKYMPGSGVDHITPAYFSSNTIMKICQQSEEIFSKLGFEDWARFDGFLLKNNQIIWNDLNSIPGAGQDGILFQQSIYLGIDTFNLCKFFLKKILLKENIDLQIDKQKYNQPIHIGVLGGGDTSERQVSRMSWYNVIEKIERLHKYALIYLFMDRQQDIWQVPRSYTLKHTVEEIEKLIANPLKLESNSFYKKLYQRAGKMFEEISQQDFKPKKVELSMLKKKIDYLFICLHGGIGENGTLQKQLTKAGIPFNGSSAKISEICSNKSKNHELVEIFKSKTSSNNLHKNAIEIVTPRQILIDCSSLNIFFQKNSITEKKIDKLVKSISYENFSTQFKTLFFEKFSHLVGVYFKTIIEKFNGKPFIIKPIDDGCSTGVTVCDNLERLIIYLLFFFSKTNELPIKILYHNHPVLKNSLRGIRLPEHRQKKIIFEEFLDSSKQLIELTIGVLGKKGKMIALMPSKTLAETIVLSLDEKFNKGIGPNFTPPRELTTQQIIDIRKQVGLFANKIGLEGYARLDFFYHLKKKLLYLIEVNTLPGLTPATVLYTQALVTPETQYPPSEFLDKIISFSK